MAFVPDVVGEIAGSVLGGGWLGRLKEGAYTSPSFKRHSFQCTEVSRATNKRTVEWSFSGLDEDYVDDLGHGSRKYPLVCFFNGQDHDILATAFEAALFERGAGKLEHPLYGTFNVVPTGTITRRNDLVREANQSVVEATFSTTLATIYPGVAPLGVNEVLAGAQTALSAAASAFAGVTSFQSKLDQAMGKATIRKIMRATRSTLQSVSGQVASARRGFDSNFRLLNEGLDTFIGTPLLLAQQMQGLIMAPARAVDGLRNRLEGYAALAERIFGFTLDGAQIGTSPSAKRRDANDRRCYDLSAQAAITGTIESALLNEYTNRAEALAAADEVLRAFEDLVAWRDDMLGDQALTDAGGAIGELNAAAALTAGYLVQLSFTLLPERRMVLNRARTMIDLCAELYGSVDEPALALFESTNRLTGSEILELPKGREVVWYSAAA